MGCHFIALGCIHPKYHYINQVNPSTNTCFMADFGDDEDIHLFQLAKMFVDSNNPICWEYVLKRMKAFRTTRKTKKQLCNRFKTLKQRYGRDLNAFPSRYHAPAVKKTKTTMTMRSRKKKDDSSDGLLPISREDVWRKMAVIFQTVPKALVRQKGGKTHLNVGETVPVGVSKLIDAINDIKIDDVFVDVGSGLGNIVCQMALETLAKMCLGLELRQDIVEFSHALIRDALPHCPRMQKVQLLAGDIKDFDMAGHALFQRATILYSFNSLFSGDSGVSLVRQLCDLQMLHTVILAAHPCPRHSRRCRKEFCLLWKLEKTALLQVSYTVNVVPFYIFKRHE